MDKSISITKSKFSTYIQANIPWTNQYHCLYEKNDPLCKEVFVTPIEPNKSPFVKAEYDLLWNFLGLKICLHNKESFDMARPLCITSPTSKMNDYIFEKVRKVFNHHNLDKEVKETEYESYAYHDSKGNVLFNYALLHFNEYMFLDIFDKNIVFEPFMSGGVVYLESDLEVNLINIRNDRIELINNFMIGKDLLSKKARQLNFEHAQFFKKAQVKSAQEAEETIKLFLESINMSEEEFIKQRYELNEIPFITQNSKYDECIFFKKNEVFKDMEREYALECYELEAQRPAYFSFGDKERQELISNKIKDFFNKLSKNVKVTKNKIYNYYYY